MLTILQMLKAKNNENMIRDVSTSKEEIDLKLTIRQWLYGKDGTVYLRTLSHVLNWMNTDKILVNMKKMANAHSDCSIGKM